MSTDAQAFADIALEALPRPAAVESLDVEAIISARKAELIAAMPALAPVLALESEPLTKLVQASAYREILLRQRYNEEALALTLAYALGADLDHIGLTYYQEPRLTGEADAAYRRRLQLKPASWSTAGPRDAYLFHALSAHPDVLDAGVTSPVPGMSVVAILGKAEDGAPTPAMLAAVEARLNTESVRPLCETVRVQAAQVALYAAHVRIWTYPGADGQAKAAEASQALQALVSSLYAMGRDVPRSAVAAAAHVAGVQRVEVVHPAQDVVCDGTRAARCTWVNVDWAGVDQ